MRLVLSILLFNLSLSCTTTTSAPPSKFNITIKSPSNEKPPRQTPYKSLHVRYTFSNNDNDDHQWTLVGIEPLLQVSSIKNIEQISVHLSQQSTDTLGQGSIWYDNDGERGGNEAQGMLIYYWTSQSSLSPFRISDVLGFQLDKVKSIVLSVTYSEERQAYEDQVEVILYVSTDIPRFYMGTIVIGDRKRGTRFSCRLSSYPRLLYGVKGLFPATNNLRWRIYAIRNRSFGRKSIESVVNSSTLPIQSELDIEILPGDVFLIPDDYLLVECRDTSSADCRFLIYYTYRNILDKSHTENDYICSTNDYPNIFKLIPSGSVAQSEPASSAMWHTDGTTAFILICLLLIVIWISIIIGCIIMRRIRGMVNFRTEPSTPYLTEYTRNVFTARRAAQDQHNQKISSEGDRTAQLDIEHMGLTS